MRNVSITTKNEEILPVYGNWQRKTRNCSVFRLKTLYFKRFHYFLCHDFLYFPFICGVSSLFS